MLETVTVNSVPAFEGVAVAGFTVQLGGAPVPQLRATELEYPFNAVRVPVNCTEELTLVVSGELLMFSA